MIGNWKASNMTKALLVNNGFTIIELLVTMPIIGILVLLVFTSTASNMNIIKNVDNEVELQQQAQFIFDFIEEKIIQSTGIIYLQDLKGIQKHNSNEKVSILKIIFKNTSDHIDKGYIFALTKDPQNDFYNLKYGIGTMGGASDEVGNFIKSIEVEPIPRYKNYIEAEGIYICINFALDGCTQTFDNSYFFRNFSRRVQN